MVMQLARIILVELQEMPLCGYFFIIFMCFISFVKV